MIRRVTVEGFKSLSRVADLELPPMAVLFGPNTSGKSNFIDALQALSRVGTCRTIGEALQDPIRGYPVETFAFSESGLPGLLGQESAAFTLGARLALGGARPEQYDYHVTVRITPSTGVLSVEDECLAPLTASGASRGKALIEKVESDGKAELRIRRKSKPAHPRTEVCGLNHTMLSDLRLAGVEYRGIERCREDLSGWRTYYLDPRVAMRRAVPPSEVRDIGVLGESIAPFLYRLKQTEEKAFAAVRRLLGALIPNIEALDVDLDRRRGTLDVTLRQNGVDYSSRVVSEGTLRVLALCAIAVNPWPPSLIAFEEPENGVQPRRLELIADLLASLAREDGRQLVVTTHSPLFTAAVIKRAREARFRDKIGLFNTRRGLAGTEIRPFDVAGPLFEKSDIARALADRGEDGVFEGLALRGMLDE